MWRVRVSFQLSAEFSSIQTDLATTTNTSRMSEVYSDLPQDLSAKFKTVGVQTEDNKSSVEALQDVLTGLSEKQTRILLGVITSVLFKSEQNANHYENSINELHKVCLIELFISEYNFYE